MNISTSEEAVVVPHFFPHFFPVSEFAERHKIPVGAAMGGAETMYPEYRSKLGQNREPAVR